jgi:hypothetical protein
LPIAVGIKYALSPVVNIRVEIIYRKLWTDYLDDVSRRYIDPLLFQQYFSPSKANLATRLSDRRFGTPGLSTTSGDIRGNDNNNDCYFSGLIKISVVIGRDRRT